MTKQQLKQVYKGLEDTKCPLLDYNAISEHLRKLNYPETALNNFLCCGEDTGMYMFGRCGCGTYPIPLKVVCNNKFCPICSKRRTERLTRRLLPYLRSFKNNNLHKWRFITISPRSYKNYEDGKIHIRETWKKFLKRKYIKDRMVGGFMSVEVTNKNGLWHFHIHAIIYSRYLDNTLRGFCKKCGQNYLKFNRNDKKIYCGNRNCGQLYEGIIKESRVSREFFESGHRDNMVDISQARNPKTALNYMIKYLSMEKDSFSNVEDFAYHIAKSYKERQINSFGKFYSFKKQIEKDHKLQVFKRCSCCGEIVKFSFDIDLSILVRDSRNKKPKPRVKYLYCFDD